MKSILELAREIRDTGNDMRKGHAFEIVCGCGTKSKIYFVPEGMIDRVIDAAHDIITIREGQQNENR